MAAVPIHSDLECMKIKSVTILTFSSSICYEVMGLDAMILVLWMLHYKEGWKMKNWCFWTVVLEKTLESPLDSNKIKPVNPKGNQPWVFIRKTDAEAKAPTFWPPDVKGQLTGKDPDPGKDRRQKGKRAAEDEMVK